MISESIASSLRSDADYLAHYGTACSGVEEHSGARNEHFQGAYANSHNGQDQRQDPSRNADDG